MPTRSVVLNVPILVRLDLDKNKGAFFFDEEKSGHDSGEMENFSFPTAPLIES